MDLLASPRRRQILFGLLYFSEGAPIGFIWLGLPTRLRAMDVPVDRITWLMALLILPWTLKFLWAPLIDLVQGPRWKRKHWIIVSQSMMALTLLPLLLLDLSTGFTAVALWLLAHAVAAATQDVAIDAMCIEQSTPQERGPLNGAMQCGVLIGRAVMGGGSLMMERWIGFQGVVLVLVGLVFSSMVLLFFANESSDDESSDDHSSSGSLISRMRGMLCELRRAGSRGRVWIGFAFVLLVPAAFKSVEAIVGPFLIDRGYSEFDIGRFTSTAMIGGMIFGSILAGRLSKRLADVRLLAAAVVFNLTALWSLAIADLGFAQVAGTHLLIALTVISISIGCLTVAMYNWLMNMTEPAIAATQFTAFMALSNVCEAWSTYVIGKIQTALGYPASVSIMCGISVLATAMLFGLAKARSTRVRSTRVRSA